MTSSKDLAASIPGNHWTFKTLLQYGTTLGIGHTKHLPNHGEVFFNKQSGKF